MSVREIEMENRIQKEKDFHDKAFGEHTRASVGKFYSIIESSRRLYTKILFNDCADKRALEYGCGPDSYACALAKDGAEVVGIDISEVAIRQSNERAAREDVSSRATFQVMNAEELQFEDARFDMVFGTGILHHLDLKKALPEIARVMKRDGKAVFIEPLGHNPFINLYRRLTPKLRTEDEHPLLSHDLELMGDYFEVVELTPFHLFSLFAVPLRKAKNFSSIVKAFDAMDRQSFKLSFFRKQAWQVVIELSKPRRAVPGGMMQGK